MWTRCLCEVGDDEVHSRSCQDPVSQARGGAGAQHAGPVESYELVPAADAPADACFVLSVVDLATVGSAPPDLACPTHLLLLVERSSTGMLRGTSHWRCKSTQILALERGAGSG